MIGMQYKIMLPKDYDMNIIRKRVSDNGHKTDGFSDLMFKFYLITEKSNFNNHYNSYAPLYLWKNNEGMNQFIFDGYYDGILDSFGWQHINIGVPLFINVNEKIKNTKYVVEYVNAIPQNNSLKNIKNEILKKFSVLVDDGKIGSICIYNPDKWGYSYFKLYDGVPDNTENCNSVYEILHISE